MMKAYVEEREGKFWVVPHKRLCLPQIPIKEKHIADRAAHAINAAFSAGQEDVKANLRDLIGCEPKGAIDWSE